MNNIQAMLKNILFVNNGIDYVSADFIDKIKLLKRYTCATVKFITFEYDHNYTSKATELQQKIDSHTDSVLNMYNFFRQNNSFTNNVTPFYHSKKEDGFYAFRKEYQENVYLYFQDGICKKQKVFDGNIIRQIEYFNNNREIMKVNKYDELGYLEKTVIMEYGNVFKELYFTRDGKQFLSKINNFNSNGEIISKWIYLFNIDENRVYEFKNEVQLKFHFLNELSRHENTAIITEDPCMYQLIESYNNTSAFKIYFAKPNNMFLQDSNTIINFSAFDGVIFSSETEKQYIINQFGNRGNFFVAPPFLLSENLHRMDDNLSNNKCVVVDVIDNDTIQLEQIIRAFRIVVDQITDATLIIRDVKSLDQIIFKLINDLDLTNNVKLQEKIFGVYQIADFSISITKPQHNVLEVIRSIYSGRPVIAYGSNHEISSIIDEGYNGYLISNNSIKVLSNRIITLMSDSEVLDEMRRNAYESSREYSEDNYLKNWHSIVREIVDKHPKRTTLTNMVVYMLNCMWIENDTLAITNQIILNGKGSIYSQPNIYAILINRSNNDKIILNGETQKINELIYEETNFISFSVLDLSQSIWDLSMCLEWENCYFCKRIGHYRMEYSMITLEPNLINNRTITPYLTDVGENLSFKIGKFIPEV